MKMNRTNPIVIHVPIQTIYRNFIDSIADIIWDDINLVKNNDFMADIETLAKEDVEGIRSLFQQGHTMMFLGSQHCQTVEDCCNHQRDPDCINSKPGVEVRLYDRKGECVGVILNNQINY